MKFSIVTAVFLTALTAAIGIYLWANGFPPEKVGLSPGKQQLREIVTFPLFWAGLTGSISGFLIWFKRHSLSATGIKANLIPKVGVQMPALIGLMSQIYVALDLYGYTDGNGFQIAFFYLFSGFVLVMGNYVVTAPFGSRVGFKTKATLSDKTIWARAHRLLGRNLVFAAIVTLPLPFLIPGQIALWVLLGLLCVIKVATWIHARQLAAQMSLRKT
ncbi:MAG: SdpI family protein [Erythrobacter sp.]